tara:strand:+ start:207 stop:446 length:240 start_codon:yes stop_codon:yes gene_type:complete
MKKRKFEDEDECNKKYITKLYKYNNSASSSTFYNLNTLKKELKEELKKELKEELIRELRTEIKKEISEEKKLREFSYYS